MRIAHVDSALPPVPVARNEAELVRQSDSPPAAGERDELRTSRGILFSVTAGMAFWVLIIWAIRLLLK